MGDEWILTQLNQRESENVRMLLIGEIMQKKLNLRKIAAAQEQGNDTAALENKLDTTTKEVENNSVNAFSGFISEGVLESKVDEEGVQTALEEATNESTIEPGSPMTTETVEVNRSTAVTMNESLIAARVTDAVMRSLNDQFSERIFQIAESMGSGMTELAGEIRASYNEFKTISKLDRDNTTLSDDAKRIIDKMEEFGKKLEVLKDDPGVRKVMEKAAAGSKSTLSKMWRIFSCLLKSLLWLAPLGFLLFFMIQYSIDNTGCFVFADTASAKLACSEGASPIKEKNCVCGGGYTADLKCDSAIYTSTTADCKYGDGKDGAGPPTVCELSDINVLKAVGKPYATCSSNPVGKDGVFFMPGNKSLLWRRWQPFLSG